MRPSINIRQLPIGQVTFCKLPSTFLAAVRSSVNIHLLSVWLGDLPSVSVNFPCGQENLPSTSINFLCSWETFYHFPLTIHAPCTPPVFFLQHTLRSEDLLSISVNFPCSRDIFRQLPFNFRAASGRYKNFPCGCKTLSHFQSNFCAAGRTSVKFCPISMLPRDLPSSFVDFLNIR